MPLDGVDLLTVKDIAQLLRCSKTHVCNLMAGRVHGCAPMPALRLGRRMLVRRASLLSWIDHNECPVANDNMRPAANDNLKLSSERGLKTLKG
jgi:excisionase family DNA binding protein